MFRNFHSVPRGDSFNLPGFSFLSNRLQPDLFGPLSLIWLFGNSRAISIPALLECLCTLHAHKLRRDFLLVAPRVPVRLPAFRPPRGKTNSTADGNPSQIGGSTPLAYRF